MPDSGVRDAGASPRARGGAAAADAGSVLRYNNALQIVSNCAWYVATPFIPLYLVSLGTPVSIVGAVIGSAGILPLLVSLHAGALVDERGTGVVAQGSVLLFALGGVILTTLHHVGAVAVAYTLMTVANIGFAVAPQAVVAAVSTPQTRVQNFGYYALWNSAGAVAGPVLGGFVVGRYGYVASFALVWILMAPCYWISTRLRIAPPSRHVSVATAHTRIATIVRQPGVAAILFISFTMVWVQTLQQSFYPLYLHQVGLPATLIGVVIGAISLSSMLVRSVLSRSVDRFGYGWLLLGATVLVAIALGLTPQARSFWPLVVLSGLMGVGLGFTQPLSMSLTVASVASEFWGMALGIRQGVQRVASIVSPVVFGVVTTALGLEPVFYIGGGTILALTPVIASVTRHLRRAPGD